MTTHGPIHERGAALLTVLMLVAVMAVISATALERLTLSTRLAAAGQGIEQARFYALAAEQLALRRVAALTVDGQTLDGAWQARALTVPLPEGSATLTLTDGANCFNINSLVNESGTVRPQSADQFVRLMVMNGVNSTDADRIAAAAIDWIDPDQNTAPGGAEDSAYSARGGRTPDARMTSASELAQLAGMTPQHWQRLRAFVCALPTSDQSPININTLRPQQASLLQMLLSTPLETTRARAIIAARPASGFGSVNRFWRNPAFGGAAPTSDVAAQVRLTTRWFALSSRVSVGGANPQTTLDSSALIDAGDVSVGAPARVVRRSLATDG